MQSIPLQPRFLIQAKHHIHILHSGMSAPLADAVQDAENNQTIAPLIDIGPMMSDKRQKLLRRSSLIIRPIG